MVQKYLMAIDAGTGSVRVILFDTYGNEIYVSQSEWTHKEDSRYPGSMNFDVHTNFNIISKLIKKTVTESKIDPNHILAISTTSMREAIVLYDENGIELWACANVDSRSDNEVINLNKSYPKLEKEIYQISGQTFSLGAIPRILWVKSNLPNLYQKTRYVTMLNDWITYKLTNIISVEPSNGCTTGLFNIKNRTWDSTLANRVDLKDDIYPIVHESGTVIGNVTNEIAGLTGLSTKTKVVAGGGDAQLGCIGLGVIHEGDAAVLGGSFWQYEYTTTSIKPDESARVRVNCHAIPNTWQYEAIAFYPGLVMRWFRDSFCELEKYMQDQINQNVYEQMENRAAKVPVGSYGMIATFSNKMNYISWKHAAPSFINFKLDAEKYNKATFYRAIMENAAFVTRGNIELVSDITNTYPDTIIFAGGASNSDLWCQIVSDVLNKPVKVPIVKESTALGAAICAGIGANVYDSFQDAISKVVKIEKEYQPIQENHLIYSRLYEKWESVYLHQLNLADKGLTEHMWSSPGV